MVKYFVMGAAVGAATLLPAGFAWWLAQAQAQPVVPVQCPQNPEWMQGFGFQELMELRPDQYRYAWVSASEGNVRRGAGYESAVAFTLPKNTQVTVIGEAWDSGCNPWMQVSTSQGDLWMHGSILTYNEGGGPIEPKPPPEERWVIDVCPKADWMRDFRLFELNALASWQYRPAQVNVRNGANIRDGVGFDSDIIAALPNNTIVTVIGEAWDSDCNQWMRVETGTGLYWMSGNTLDYNVNQSVGTNDDSPSLVLDQCPKAVWTEGYRINELIPLAEQQYHTAFASEDATPLRSNNGFDSNVIANANNGEPMVIVGEAWDNGCNQWMQVAWNNQRLWVYGNQVRK
jgi:uncharacterized protein YgiM (DUF1202 family)